MKFTCIKTTPWPEMTKEGQVIEKEKIEDIPESVRPYFVSAGQTKEEQSPPIEAIPEATEEQEIERLRSELEVLGKAADKRWGRDRLELEIKQAKKRM